MTETHDAWEIVVRIESPNIDGVRWSSKIHVNSFKHRPVLRDTLRMLGQDILNATIDSAMEDYYLLLR